MRHIIVAACLLAVTASPGLAQKHGGVLHFYHPDSPASMSILEEATPTVAIPMSAVFNGLVMYDQHIAQNSLKTIVPDLATSWSWSADGLRLTFKLRHGVKWHDGKPFTAADVKCTWDRLTGRDPNERLRANPRRAWWSNIAEMTVGGDDEATFVLQRPQPALLAMIASGYSPVYPCHVSPATMRRHPIGTGPFKFVEYKPEERIVLARNPDYWKPGLPYLDGIEYTIVPNRSTEVLGFIAGKFDVSFPYLLSVALLKDVQKEAPQSVCELHTTNSSINLIVNRDAEPFNDYSIRRAMQLTLDRRAFIDILAEGNGLIGGAMLPPPAGLWGMPPDILKTVVGYDPDVRKNRIEARNLMQASGYAADKHLAIKVSTRNIPVYRDPAIVLIDQLKEIYIDAELDTVETANWFPKIARKEYQIGLNLTAAGVDDPDVQFYENYACGSERNYTGYCNKELDQLFERQSREADQEKRKQLVWEIDKQLQEDSARPIIYHWLGGTCWKKDVKNFATAVNSLTNSWRFEDVWLDR
jgi:peptide/nickel transport system substrate-binding protein